MYHFWAFCTLQLAHAVMLPDVLPPDGLIQSAGASLKNATNQC
jgi:hypothetical protein